MLNVSRIFLILHVARQVWLWAAVPFPVTDPYKEEPPWRESCLSTSEDMCANMYPHRLTVASDKGIARAKLGHRRPAGRRQLPVLPLLLWVFIPQFAPFRQKCHSVQIGLTVGDSRQTMAYTSLSPWFSSPNSSTSSASTGGRGRSAAPYHTFPFGLSLSSSVTCCTSSASTAFAKHTGRATRAVQRETLTGRERRPGCSSPLPQWRYPPSRALPNFAQIGATATGEI